MKSNFDFLKNIDKELYEIILDSEKLFRDEYFNQSVVQLRIFCEKTAKKILGNTSKELTFDDTINCLKDSANSDLEKEFIDDLYFIKQEGNKCAHGEDTEASTVLEAIERTFEIAINFARAKTKTDKFDKLIFDKTLLITGKEQKEVKLVDKYLELAAQEKENLLNLKQGEFNSKVPNEDENGFKDKNRVSDVNQYKENTPKKGRKKKELTDKQKEIKEKVKAAKKNLKENINNLDKTDNKKKKENKKPAKPAKPKSQKGSKKAKKDDSSEFLKTFVLVLFFITAIFFLCKMIFVF